MTYLVDTNVLLRFVDRSAPAFPITRRAIGELLKQGDRLVTTTQNLAEFWVVVTRPTAVSGLGQSAAQAERWLRRVERFFALLPDDPGTYPIWRRLVTTYSVSGVQVHDARLAAAMLAGGVTHVLTFNAGDFARFAPEGLVAVDPAGV